MSNAKTQKKQKAQDKLTSAISSEVMIELSTGQ